MYIPPHSSPGGVPFPWVLLQRYIRIYVQQYSVLFFFVSVIEPLIVVVCHVLFVTTVWISENELCESINIIMMLISAHVLVLPTDVPHRSPSYA